MCALPVPHLHSFLTPQSVSTSAPSVCLPRHVPAQLVVLYTSPPHSADVLHIPASYALLMHYTSLLSKLAAIV